MVFPPNWYDYKVSYAHPFGSIAAVLLTCAFLYASLAKNERISKGRYVLCGGIALIFPVLAALYFSNETAYLCFGILVILFLLSILEYGYCSRRNEEQPCSLLALLLALAGSLGEDRPDGVEIPLTLTHQQLADIVLSDRVTVARILSDLTTRDLLAKRGGHYILYDVPELCRLGI